MKRERGGYGEREKNWQNPSGRSSRSCIDGAKGGPNELQGLVDPFGVALLYRERLRSIIVIIPHAKPKSERLFTNVQVCYDDDDAGRV